MIEVVESSTPETLTEDTVETVIESSTSTSVIEITSQGPDILAETVTTDIVTDVQAQFVVGVEIETFVMESCEQGPPGPAGPQGDTGPAGTAETYPGKTLVYTSGKLTEVFLYSDAAKTTLAQRRELHYTGDVLNSVSFHGPGGSAFKTRTLTYTDGILTSVVEEPVFAP